MAESLCGPPKTITTLLIGYTPIQNKKLKKKKGRMENSGMVFKELKLKSLKKEASFVLDTLLN